MRKKHMLSTLCSLMCTHTQQANACTSDKFHDFKKRKKKKKKKKKLIFDSKLIFDRL